jgi:hypothetical protein
MASGTADLQRDLGGAIMQSIFGALLTAGYAAAAASAIGASGQHFSSSAENQLTKSFAGAETIAQQYPPSVQDGIVDAAKTAFLHGDQWAYLAGIVAVLAGAALVACFFPGKQREEELLAEYQASGGPEPALAENEVPAAAAPG